ncbi:MAG: TrkA family potassium uptake protein [Chloroflexota bacterium]|nr:TrkA family potassium uptake protein [Chloroflexota bacterium]
MKVVIMGCGRVGSRLAAMLDREGHTVSVIDTNQGSFNRLPADFGGTAILGTGIDEDVLRSAGIEEADAFVATTQGDNRNIMASQVAREIFGVPEVVTRLYDPVRAEIFRGLGLKTVSPTKLISGLIHDELVTALGGQGQERTEVVVGRGAAWPS